MAVAIGTIAGLWIVQWLFGAFVALCAATLLFALSIGFLWGAGVEIRKQRTGKEPRP